MASVLQAPEDRRSFEHFEGVHFNRQPATDPAGLRQPATEPDHLLTPDSYDGSGGLSLDAMLNRNANEPNGARDSQHWSSTAYGPEDKTTESSVCVPTNPGTLLHPGSCTPCAFVFRIAEGQVRNRCANGDACGWCHHPSHPRTRGRRKKSRVHPTLQNEETWTEQNAWKEKNGSSEGSTRDSSEKEGTEYEGAKTNRTTGDDRGSGKSNRAVRDDRAKNNRQKNVRDERSKYARSWQQNPANIGQPENVGRERCNTPDFDEQYVQYASPQQQYSQYAAPQYQQPQQIIYTCIPVNVAVPASPADGTTTEWAGYSPAPISPTYVHDWNSQYQPPPDVRQLAAPQPYMMVQMPAPVSPPAFLPAGYAPDQGASQGPDQAFPARQQWASGHGAAAAEQRAPNRNRFENISLERSR